ncbi:ATP-binding protein [Streptomyces sp. NPDC002845]
MIIDTTQPWGIAIDYAGRATLVEDGHTIHVNITDTSLSTVIEPDSLTGRYPTVNITAQFTETGDADTVLRGFGRTSLTPDGTDPVPPDQTAVQTAVAAALADFQDRKTAYEALCAAWSTPDDDGGTEPSEDPVESADPVETAETSETAETAEA